MTKRTPGEGISIPPELEPVRAAARRAVQGLKPADDSTRADPKFLFTAQETEPGRKLPPYQLVYFLLVDLLGFRNLGQFEKIAWSVPVDFKGQAFLIEHRKFGVGVFAHDAKAENDQAREIVTLIQKGVKAAEPFFEWLADQAIRNSKLNVNNSSRALFDRYTYFRKMYRRADARATAHAEDRRVTKRGAVTIMRFPGIRMRLNARWLALAAIDAFFSWTEHVLIHVAIILGRATSGAEVADLAAADWPEKFKKVLDLTDPATKALFDQLVDIRRQLRNFMAHGAFGKRGEAFLFHSGAGAVPLLLPHKAGKSKYALNDEFSFDEDEALAVIDRFIQHLWSGPRAPAKLYIQKAEMTLILPMAADGTYTKAMSSMRDMKEFMKDLGFRMERAKNMDF